MRLKGIDAFVDFRDEKTMTRLVESVPVLPDKINCVIYIEITRVLQEECVT